MFSGRILALVGLSACALLSACGASGLEVTGGDGDVAPRVLTLSAVWQRSVEPERFESRAEELSGALNGLRARTRSGWVGRQDDVTGYVGELRGGRFEWNDDPDPTAVATALLAEHGPQLFGIGPDALALAPPDPPDRSGGMVVRASQRVGDVPVLDGTLVLTVGPGRMGAAVTLVQGRVFPGIAVDPTPVITAAGAAAAAADVSGGDSQGPPRLVVLPFGESGALAWEVRIQRTGAREVVSLYYVDAVRGEILTIRPASADLSRIAAWHPGLLPAARSAAVAEPVRGTAVQVQGTGPNGEDLTAQGIRTPEGRILLIDTTVPTYDPVTGRGAIETHDGRQSLPGPVWESKSPTIDDPQAIAAQAFSRFIFDYYLEVHARRSWDGNGRTMLSSIHGQKGCDNAYFNGSQMVYLEPCVRNGRPSARTLLDIDVTAHEITHGVTDSTAGLAYTGQSGAMNESFSDYFGNVIGNLFTGLDDDLVGEGVCAGISEPTGLCDRTPTGEIAVRHLQGGQGFDDYLYALTPPYFFSQVLGFNQDNGGVHMNSSIWNDALWGIRRRLAMIDGTTMQQSPRARLFDSIVYTALTRHLTSSSGFLDARTAIEQAAMEQRADATTVRVIRETFDQSLICTGCVPTPSTQAEVISAGTAADGIPAVSGDQVAWLSGFLIGQASEASAGGAGAPVPALGEIYSLAFAGQSLVVATIQDDVVRVDPASGSTQEIDGSIGDDLGIGLAGSEAGAAWINFAERMAGFVDPDGRTSMAALPTGTGRILALGTGGGIVAAGTDKGEVIVWDPASGQRPEVIGQTPQAVAAIDVHGDNLVAISANVMDPATEVAPLRVMLFDLTTGSARAISTRGSFFGVTVSEEYAVWAEQVGRLGGGVAATFGAPPDTNLYLYSFANGTTYEVLDQRGQQGFPAISGRRLVWQDAVNGGDDIYTAILPAGL